MQNDNGHHFAYGRLKRPLKKEALGGAKIIPQKTPLCVSWAINFFYGVDSYLQ